MNKKLIECGMSIMQEFCVALQNVDGNVGIDLKKISAWDLLCLLSTNNIKFSIKDEKEKILCDEEFRKLQ